MNFKLNVKTGLFGISAILILATTIQALVSLQRLNEFQKYSEESNDRFHFLINVEELGRNLYRARMYILAAAITEDQDNRLNNLESSARALNSVAEYAKRMDTFKDQEFSAVVQETLHEIDVYNEIVGSVADDLKRGRLVDAINTIESRCIKQFEKLRLMTDGIVDKAQSQFDKQNTRLNSTFTEIKRAIIIAASIISILGSVFIIFFYLNITGRLFVRLSEIIHSNEAIEQTTMSLAVFSNELSDSTAKVAEGVQDISEQLQEIKHVSSHFSQQSRNLFEIVDHAVEEARRGTSLMQDLEQTMSRLEESSRKVSDLSEAINDIAFQTNLLALNAAVEAARANDHGRGFAVVAEAVRILANDCKNLATTITQTIAVSTEQVVQSRAKTHLVMSVISKLSELTHSVMKAAEVQTQQISTQESSLSSISKAVESQDSSARTNAEVSRKLTESSGSLQEQVDVLASAVKNIGTVIGKTKDAEADKLIA